MCYIYTISSIQKYDIGDGLNRLVYVGSCMDYERRFADHKKYCFNPNSKNYNFKLYQLIRQYGWDEFVFEVIEVLDDTTTDRDLRFREQHYIDKYDSKSSMNTNDAIILLDMVEYHRLYGVEYYKNNREKQLAQSNERYKHNREKIIAQSTEWNKTNRDRHNEIMRKLYHKKSLWRKALTDLRKIEPSFFC